MSGDIEKSIKLSRLRELVYYIYFTRLLEEKYCDFNLINNYSYF